MTMPMRQALVCAVSRIGAHHVEALSYLHVDMRIDRTMFLAEIDPSMLIKLPRSEVVFTAQLTMSVRPFPTGRRPASRGWQR